MEDNSWKLVDLTENASSNSAAAKRAATLNPPGEARSGCEKSAGWFGELERGQALPSEAAKTTGFGHYILFNRLGSFAHNKVKHDSVPVPSRTLRSVLQSSVSSFF